MIMKIIYDINLLISFDDVNLFQFWTSNELRDSKFDVYM